MLRLYKALTAHRSVTLAVDLTVSARLPSVPITCFGMQTCVTFSHAWLHKRTGAPIIPTHCEPLPGGRYRLVLHPALEISPDATHQRSRRHAGIASSLSSSGILRLALDV
jgi:lauroyl/myristoyl acyltransferase